LALLAEKYDLVVTEEVLDAAAAATDGVLWQEVHRIHVFARMSPHGKATVIRMIQLHQKGHVLMCGDGGNDVGALKQADCGVALLAGYGNSNTTATAHAEAPTAVAAACAVPGASTVPASSGTAPSPSAADEPHQPQPPPSPAPQSAPGDTTIRPGDASMAAPFTSKRPSVRSVVDLIRQGRCTLLGTLQQQQIMVIQSVIAAFKLSAMSLESVRDSELQNVGTLCLVMVTAVAFSKCSPVERLAPQRPLSSLFHPAVVVSTVGQSAIHLLGMWHGVRLATSHMDTAKLADIASSNERQEFTPNLLNTVLFLVETAQIIAIFAVNYKGRPWMQGIVENHALMLSLLATVGMLLLLGWSVVPGLNRLLQMEDFPTDHFRWQVVAIMATSLFGTLLCDRLSTAIFAPAAFKAMCDEAALTGFSDFVPLAFTLAKVVLPLIAIFSFDLDPALLTLAAVLFWFARRK
jgi:cation-transporting ATPase 13A1